MKKKVFIVMLAVVMLMSLGLVGCGGGSDEEAAPADQTEESATDDSAAEPAAETDADGGDVCKIVFIPKNLGNPYFEAINTGFEKAIEEIGADKFDYQMVGPATAEATSQIEYITAAVQNGANAIFIAANSNDALNATFDDARAAGTSIYIINQDIPGSEDHRDAAIMPCNFENVGKAQLALMSSQIDNKGEFAILSATTDAPDQNFWVDSMKEIMDSGEYADMKLVDVVYGDDQPEKSTTEMEALLTKYPDLKGVIAPTTVGIAAAAKVVQTKGIADKVRVTGLGLPSEMKQFVEDGTCLGFQLWDPPLEGYMAVYMAYAQKNGEFTPGPGATFKAGENEYSMLDNGQVMSLEEPKLFDKNNLAEFVY
jgi:rhamnose transport system substrate-binding protein